MVLALVAVCLTVLIGIVAIALDGGRIMEERRHAQATADAAALAAAYQLYEEYVSNPAKFDGTDPDGSAHQSAYAIAADNGYTNDGTNSVVTVNTPPLSGRFVGRAGYAEVIVQFKQNRSFSRIFAGGPNLVGARAVAREQPPQATIGLMILDPSRSGALDLSGTSNLTVNVGPLQINSNSANAATASGSSGAIAQQINVAGNPGLSPPSKFVAINGIKTGAPPLPDPLQSLPTPDAATLGLTNQTVPAPVGGVITLQPGVYQNGLSFSSQQVVIMSPGIYILGGNGLSLSGQASATAASVMIYTAGNIIVSGGAHLVMTPTTISPYQGLSIFLDRNAPNAITISGNGTQISGTVYAPNAAVTVSGNGSMTAASLVARAVTLTGHGQLTIGQSNGSSASYPRFQLVE